MLSACAIGGDSDDPTLESLLSGTATISLTGSSTRVSLTTDSEWSLSKTGSLSGNTVTWNIAATKTATTSGHLLIQGQMTVTNTGTGPATIGNIVVNLQKRQSNKWVTQSTNVANATQGDAATTANIHKAASSENRTTWSENSASGSLNFMDATNNTVFSLVPQVLIASGETRTLLFSASFDNNDAALNLTPGTLIRAEVIVTFGNATKNGNSTADLDINGNGTLDADESRVRSVPSRLTVSVPAAVNGNVTPTLSDTLADVVAGGDVSISNVSFNLGATSGTVVATINPGTNGGTITNCAYLTSPDQQVSSGGYGFTIVEGLDLQACSTINVTGTGGPPPPCTHGTAGCPWVTSDLVTWSQSEWGESSTTAGSLLVANWNSLYLSDLVVGGTNEARFTEPLAVFRFLPQTDTPGFLTQDLSDPGSSSAGEFAAQQIALTINIDFSAAGYLPRTTALGDLLICNFALVPDVNGMSVANFLALANEVLGGNMSTALTPDEANLVASRINNSFLAGNPSSFAQNNLRVGTCAN